MFDLWKMKNTLIILSHYLFHLSTQINVEG